MTEPKQRTEPQPSIRFRKTVTGGTHNLVGRILILGLALTHLLVVARADEAFPPLFPFLISYDGADNASSMAHLLDAPAGKHGFLRAENGRFVNDAGPVRLHATNLTGPANFPTHAQADRLAARLARFGINCVRLHHMDTYWKWLGIIADDPTTQRNFDPAQVERLDYLIAALKKRGIYVNINLHVGRWWDDRDGFPGKDKRPKFDKGLDNFEPRMIELQKEYARKLLTHVNLHTGLTYADDPCVAMVELNNENALSASYRWGNIDRLPEPYASEWRRQWNDWLRKKYASTTAMLEAWEQSPAPPVDKQAPEGKANQSVAEFAAGQRIEDGSFPTIQFGSSTAPQPAVRDFDQFRMDTERRYWVGLSDYLKRELGVKSLIAGTQLGWSPASIQAELDYVDSHDYWCHPGGRDLLHDRYNWQLRNDSMVNSLATIKGLASRRVIGKPYTVSEYNHPFPNQYGAEGQPLLSAYGRLQGWDGVFQYTYNHDPNFEPNINPRYFDMIARTDVLAHFPACAAIFLRGDVQEAKSTIIGAKDARLGLQHKTGIDLSGKFTDDPTSAKMISHTQKVFVSDTGELTWNVEQPDAGYWTVATPNTKLFTGFPKGRLIQLGGVTLAVGRTRLQWATVSLVSRRGTGFGESTRPANILVAATGVSENKGMTIEKLADDAKSNNAITIRDKWGEGPVCVEGIPATITLPADPSRAKCFALDPHGDRKKEVPVEKADGGGSRILLKPEYETVWYEIDLR